MKRETGRPVTALVIEAAAGAVLALLAVVQLVSIVHGGGSRHAVGAFVLTLAAVVALAVVGYLSVHHEHQLRSAASYAQAASASVATVATASVASTMPTVLPTVLPPATSVIPRRGRGRRYGPVSSAIITAMLVLGSILGLAGSYVSYQHGVRSHLTQTSGIPSAGVVDSVDHIKHTGKYNTWYTADVYVTLADRSTTVVHDPHDVDMGFGQIVQVLTDPKDPSYSEFPGQPDSGRYTWILVLVLSLVIGASAGIAVRGLVRMRRHGGTRVTWTPADKSPPASAAT